MFRLMGNLGSVELDLTTHGGLEGCLRSWEPVVATFLRTQWGDRCHPTTGIIPAKGGCVDGNEKVCKPKPLHRPLVISISCHLLCRTTHARCTAVCAPTRRWRPTKAWATPAWGARTGSVVLYTQKFSDSEEQLSESVMKWLRGGCCSPSSLEHDPVVLFAVGCYTYRIHQRLSFFVEEVSHCTHTDSTGTFPTNQAASLVSILASVSLHPDHLLGWLRVVTRLFSPNYHVPGCRPPALY